jgi:uncharacterized protein YhjY with autotransporter beta-barrel domain
MKTLKNITPRQTAAILAIGLLSVLTRLPAQLTPVPDHFTNWTGNVSSDFFNPDNWSTGIVPDGADVAIRMPGDPGIPYKHIIANYTGIGDKTLQFYSIQSGANKVYTVEFSGNEDGWLIVNPVGKGFTFNGVIGQSMGLSHDITYQESVGDSSNRLASYYILNSYTKLTLDGSTAAIRVQESGLSSGVFTLNGNAVMDVSNAGNNPFIHASGTYSAVRTNYLQIGGLQTGAGSYVYVGSREMNLNSRMATGEVSVLGGVFEGVNTGNAQCYLYGWKTRMTGIVNFTGDGRGRFQIMSNAEYIVDGVHNGNILVNSGGALGGSGIINGPIIVESGGLFTPGERDTATDNPLTVNAPTFTVNGNLGFDMITHDVYDRLTLNITGTMAINGRDVTVVDPETGAESVVNGNANLVIGMAGTFPRKAGAYDVMTVNFLRTYDVYGAVATAGVIRGDFGKNISFPVSLSLASSAEWLTEQDGYGETKRTLRISFKQGRFSLDDGRHEEQLLRGGRLLVANQIDELYSQGYFDGNTALADTYEPLFDQLNRQPSITLYRELLDQLTPTTFQSWFPSAVVRTSSLVQSLEDRMYQDAAFKRKKGSFQMYLDGFRHEASHAQDEDIAYSNFNTIGTVVGASYAFGENFVAGGFLSYESTEFDLDTDRGKTDSKSYAFGVNGRYNKGNFQLNLAAFYGFDDYKSKRSTKLTGLGQWSESDTDGSRLGAAASLSYMLNLPWFEVTPIAGIQWLNWKTDAFQERGAGAASLHVYEQDETSLQGKLGIRVARSFGIRKGIIRPYIHYAFLHEFEDAQRTLWYRGLDNPHDMYMDAPGSYGKGYRIDVGLDWNATRNLRIELRYQSEYRTSVNENVGVRAAVNYTF